MYNVVIVTAKKAEINQILSQIDLSTLPLRIVGIYDNYTQSKQALYDIFPEIIIVDRYNYFIDYNTLTNELIKANLPIQVICLLDAKNSEITQNIKYSIAQPFNKEQILSVLSEVCTHLDQHYPTYSTQIQLQKMRISSLEYIQNNDLRQLMYIPQTDIALLQKLNREGVDLSLPYTLVAVIGQDRERSTTTYADANLIIHLTKVFFSQWRKSSDDFTCHTFTNNNQTVLLMQSTQQFNKQKIERFFDGLMKQLRQVLNTQLSLGISSLDDNNATYNMLFTRARRALNLRKVAQINQMTFFDDLHGNDFANFAITNIDYQKIANALSFDTINEAKSVIGELLDTAMQKQHYSSSKYVYYNLLCTILGACASIDTLESNYQSQEQIFTQFLALTNNLQVSQFMLKLAEEVFKVNQLSKLNASQKNLQIIVKYIKTHYTEPSLSLNTLSANTGLSVSYISTLLKNDNTSFVTLLTKLRIDKAKLLLQNQERLVADIAYFVGFSDPYYFSHCFKKETGMSPRQYRQSLCNDKNDND